MRFLAIDYGERRTGLALCDPLEILASPYAVLDRPRDLLAEIQAVIERESVEGIVLGLPLNMDGTEGPQAQSVRRFGAALERRCRRPVVYQDERLSSVAAEEKLRQARPGKTGRQKTAVDALAAAEILSTFLERRRNNPIDPCDCTDDYSDGAGAPKEDSPL